MEILTGLYKAGYEAHRNTSFSPERRAEQVVNDYETEIAADLEMMKEEQREQYTANYKRYLFAWLNAQSRCASTMITGPANFPVRQQEKAHRSEHNKYTEFREWRERALKAIEKRERAEMTPEAKEAEIWETMQARIIDAAQTIKDIDSGVERRYSRPLFVSVIARNIETAAKRGQPETVNKALELLRKLNAETSKPVVSEKHKVFKLAQVAEVQREKKVDNSIRESRELTFEGGKLVLNYKEERLQIFHDEKPAREIIDNLKKCAFHWSPFNKCWMRKLTPNALYVVKNFVKLPFTNGCDIVSR